MKNDIVFINLKLSKKTRGDFKNATKSQNGLSMQNVLSAFIESYIEDPEQFSVRIGVKGNGQSSRKTD